MLSTNDHDGTKHHSLPAAVRNKLRTPASLRRRELSVLRQSFVPNDISYHPGFQVCFFAPPRQRQRWGDNQILPRVNWGDLFFDLFYVAAAYNTSNILVFSPDNQGMLYFLGTFLPVMGLWNDKLYYDARYAVADDLFHRIFELATLSVLATIVVFIRPVETLSHASKYVDMFGFAVAIFCGRLLTMVRYVEVYFVGEGQPVIRSSSKSQLGTLLISLVGYGAAAIVAGVAYYGNYEEINHVPIILVLVGYLSGQVFYSTVILFFFPTGGRHKLYSIPLNIDFVIHRSGEWIMLMLGESVLSLLTVGVEQEGSDYLLTFYASMISVILLQYLHFRSQPSHADQHAMRRHKNAGIGFAFFNEVYSASLIVLGSVFTLLVASFNPPTSGRRDLLNDAGVLLENDRWLTSEVLPPLDDPNVQQRVANLFCGSLAIILICLDSKFILHLGWKNACGRCKSADRKANMQGLALIVGKLALLTFIATLSRYETNPERLALIGMGCICVKLFSRLLAGHYFPPPDHHGHHHDDDHHQHHASHEQAHDKGSGDEQHHDAFSSAIVESTNSADEDKDSDSRSDGSASDGDEEEKEGEICKNHKDDDLEEGKWPNVTHARAQPANEVEM